MPCLCVLNKTWQNLTKEQIVEHLIQELTVTKNATSLSKNKLISRSDPRQSSTIVGSIGVCLICGIFGLLVIWDVPVIVRHIRAALTGRQELLWRIA